MTLAGRKKTLMKITTVTNSVMTRLEILWLMMCVALTVPALAGEPPPPGTLLDSANVGAYSDFIDETLVQLIQDGKFTLEVTTSESIAVHPAYAEATEQYRGQPSLPNEPGVLLNYVAGRPFPEPPDSNDPRAGDKLAWNLRYTYAGDSGQIKPFYWQYRNMKNGKIERELSFAAMSLRFKHRVVLDPVPDLANNQSQIFNALYLQVLAPSDIRNTQLLIHRLEDDTQQEQGWLYLGTQRRVRRLPTGQNTDAFLGSDIMIEDFLGYNGRLMDMEWRYLGTRKVLLATEPLARTAFGSLIFSARAIVFQRSSGSTVPLTCSKPCPNGISTHYRNGCITSMRKPFLPPMDGSMTTPGSYGNLRLPRTHTRITTSNRIAARTSRSSMP